MYKKIQIFLCTAFLLGACATPTLVPTATPVPTQPPSPTPEAWEREGWNIVWHDEFDGPELDRNNWNFDIGGNGWGNAEWQYYSDRPEKVRIEARMKLPYGQGIWPAFWMLGDNNKGWPASGEIDILEHIGKNPNTIYDTVHAPGYSGGKGVGSNLVVADGTLKNDFHVYAIEWHENEIRWYFDDQEYFKLTPADVPDAWIFDHDFFIIMNMAVGGRWPGYPDKTTTFPQFLTVDYVRVYQRP